MSNFFPPSEEVMFHGRDGQPVTYGEYYEATNKKHFPSKEEARDAVGSQFDTSLVSSFEKLVERVDKERGLCLLTPESDDRKLLTELGADPLCFSQSYIYVKVPYRGKLGAVPSTFLKDTTPLRVEEKLAGSGVYSFVVELAEKPQVDYGTLILEVTESGLTAITAHPGLPSYAPKEYVGLSEDEVRELRLKDFQFFKEAEKRGVLNVGVVEAYKGRDFTVNVATP